jgi:hypothetical protein
MLAISAARSADLDTARPLLETIRINWPAEAEIAAAWLAFRHELAGEAVEHVLEAFRIMTVHPWVSEASLDSLVELMADLAPARPDDAGRLLEAWATPLAVGLLGRATPNVWFRLATRLAPERQLDVLAAIGPHHPWNRDFLEFRLRALEAVSHPSAAEARRDMARLLRQEGRSLKEVVGPADSEVSRASSPSERSVGDVVAPVGRQ